MYLFDSSAWLVHLFGEPGVEQINQLFDEDKSGITISVLSNPEVFAKLKSLGQEDRWPTMWESYKLLFDKVIPVDVEVAQKAVELRQTTPQRLPTIDALIASTALVNELTIVHRDAHIEAIPESLLRQIRLPDR